MMLKEKVLRTSCSFVARVAKLFLFVRAIFDEKWRNSLTERCAAGGWLEEVWHEKDVIWFHGASVGEISGLQSLISQIRKNNPNHFILVTTTSETGKNEVLKKSIGDKAILFPLDHPKYVSRILKLVKPKLIVITETELWPNFLFAVEDLDVPIILVNGRISEYTFNRYLRFKFLFSYLLNIFQEILVQTQTDLERFVEIGALESKVKIIGSTKYSKHISSYNRLEREEYAKLLGIDLTKPCFVAGSVRAGEDEVVIRAYVRAKQKVKSLQMIIAPRHPERFARVAKLLTQYEVDFQYRSRAKRISHDVVLLDTMGELSSSYALGSFSFVGGSLENIGGHNPLEPAAHKVMVLFGPYSSNVQTVVDDLYSKGGLIMVRNEEELTTNIIKLSESPDECLARGARAYEVWKSNSGATNKILPIIEKYFSEDEVYNSKVQIG